MLKVPGNPKLKQTVIDRDMFIFSFFQRRTRQCGYVFCSLVTAPEGCGEVSCLQSSWDPFSFLLEGVLGEDEAGQLPLHLREGKKSAVVARSVE